jgi:hypothetical protein
MDVTLAVIADQAIQAADGKLSIIGIFQEIKARAFPAVHPQATIVLILRASPAEAGERKRLTVRLRWPPDRSTNYDNDHPARDRPWFGPTQDVCLLSQRRHQPPDPGSRGTIRLSSYEPRTSRRFSMPRLPWVGPPNGRLSAQRAPPCPRAC